MIDAHQHIWQIGRNGCTWPTAAETAIFRDFSLDDLRRQALPLGIASTVLVQSQENDLDTDWLLEAAAGDETVAGVVGWVDLRDLERIDALAARPKLVGLRPMVQHREACWYDRPELESGWRAMIGRGLRLDALVRTQHLESLDRLAARHPQLPIVIDHAAKPVIDSADGFDRWLEAIAPLAERPNVACKLSGLLTECGAARPEAIEPYVAAVLRLFGPERVMWGSDWPVLELVSSYADWLAMARALVPQAMRADVFGGTAERFYALSIAVPA